MDVQKKIEWYMGWSYSTPVQDEVKIAIQKYIKKYGNPPSEILIAPEEKLEPMEGFQFVVRADPYVNIHTMLLGVVDNEKICVDCEAEQE